MRNLQMTSRKDPKGNGGVRFNPSTDSNPLSPIYVAADAVAAVEQKAGKTVAGFKVTLTPIWE
jgi:hypothetical protein